MDRARWSVILSMRRFSLILAMLGCGCTESVTAEELEMREAAAEAGYGALELVPDAVADPEVGPSAPRALARGPIRIVVSPFRFDDDPLWADGTARCPFDVDAVGLPAIREDGRVIADLRSWASGFSEGEDEVVSFSLFDVETEAVSGVQVLVEGDGGERGRYDCWHWYKEAKAQAAEINDTLASGWRPMRELPVEVDPGLAPYAEADDADDRLPANVRPVQLTVRQGQVVFRVPGVKVLSRVDEKWPRPQDDEPDEGMCWYHGPFPEELVVDDKTGVVVASVRYESGPCMCDSVVTREVFRIDGETLAEIDVRARWASDDE